MNNQLIYNYKKTQRITQLLGKPKISDLEKYNQLIIVIPKKESKSIWNLIPQGKKIKELIKIIRRVRLPLLPQDSKIQNKHHSILDYWIAN